MCVCVCWYKVEFFAAQQIRESARAPSLNCLCEANSRYNQSVSLKITIIISTHTHTHMTVKSFECVACADNLLNYPHTHEK